MNYKEFDELFSEEIKQKVFHYLKEKPATCDELAKHIGMLRTSLFYHLKACRKSRYIETKKFGRKVYFGIKKEFRQEMEDETRD
jgi:predicted transcriptional regulator